MESEKILQVLEPKFLSSPYKNHKESKIIFNPAVTQYINYIFEHLLMNPFTWLEKRSGYFTQEIQYKMQLNTREFRTLNLHTKTTALKDKINEQANIVD